MIISTGGISSFLDLYKDNNFNLPITEEGQPLISKERWEKYWEIQKKTTNYLSNEKQEYWKSLTLNCLDLMEYFVAPYYIGEFDCHNEELLSEIWEPLIKGWYFSEVWIIKSDSILQQEIQQAESEVWKDTVKEEKILRNNPFRIFSRYWAKDKNKYFFKSLLTGIDCYEIDPKEMIYLSLNKGANFRKWWKINMEYLAGKSRIIDATKAISKTVQVIVRNEEAFKAEREQIDNPDIFYEVKRKTGTAAREQNIYQQMPIIESSRVKDLKDIVQSMYEKECELMGMTLNSNDKKERLTVAENYKDLRQITNLQDYQLKNLKNFEKQLKEKSWVKENFKIEISGLTFAQGLPDTVTPNNKSEENINIPKWQESQSQNQQ